MKRRSIFTLVILALLLAASGLVYQHGVVASDSDTFAEHERNIRSGIREFVEQLFPEQAAEAKARFGVYIYTGPEAEPVRAENAPAVDRMIVLIHGLDDPGHVWMNLQPTLLEHDYTVGRFEYPNDQSIADSTALLAKVLSVLKQRGVQRVDLVAHSMGGLVARDLLTSPEYPPDARPAVSQLIMVGTPQHGSPMTHLRGFAELRDQFTRTLDGDSDAPGLLGGLFDGAGEASIDLNPGSAFLTTLNDRPHPENIRYTLIAGRITPELGQLIEGPADFIGDGCVSLESTRLEGIEDYTIVEGTHLSIIRNVIEASDRTPPAMPIILDRLAK